MRRRPLDDGRRRQGRRANQREKFEERQPARPVARGPAAGESGLPEPRRTVRVRRLLHFRPAAARAKVLAGRREMEHRGRNDRRPAVFLRVRLLNTRVRHWRVSPLGVRLPRLVRALRRSKRRVGGDCADAAPEKVCGVRGFS